VHAPFVGSLVESGSGTHHSVIEKISVSVVAVIVGGVVAVVVAVVVDWNDLAGSRANSQADSFCC
jgi:hypothetical protein